MRPLKGDVTSGDNPRTDRPNHASEKPTNSFHERYNSDAEFKRQVDEARQRVKQEQGLAQLKQSLNITQNKGQKLY